MNRIDSMFAELKKQNKKALITFITAGDPDFDTTEQLVLEMERQGANLIELGVPFSDPIAEGPIIQEASLRSLQGGTTLEGIFELVKKLRTKTEIPLVFMMYINTIYRFGVERFFSLCQETGIDAVIVPDLPFEEHDEIDECAYAHGVPSVPYCAEKLCLSPNYLSDLLKKETGLSALKHIQQKTLEIAKERVYNTKKTISEISCELGFPYPQHFSRWFKKMAGCTPNEYRAAN